MHLFFPERDDVGTVISQTLRRDSVKTPQEALIEIYRKLRPGDPPTLDTATALFHGMFFDSAEVRLLAGGPPEVQHQAVRPGRRDRPATTARWSRMISTGPSATC